MSTPAAPLHILAIAPFSPSLEAAAPPLSATDSASLDAAMGKLAPTLDIALEKRLCPEGFLRLTLRNLSDFRPERLALLSPLLAELQSARDMAASGTPQETLERRFPLACKAAGLTAANPTCPAQSAGITPGATGAAPLLDELLGMVETTGGGVTEAELPDLVARIGCHLEALLHAIRLTPAFRRMEGAWRGARLLLNQLSPESAGTARLTLLPLPSGDVLPAFDTAEELLAAQPPDLIVLDLPLANTPRAMAVLERAMDLAESLLAPLALPVGPGFLGLNGWEGLSEARFIPALLENPEYARWRTLCARPGAGWIAPCILPEGSGAEERGAAWLFGALCARSMAVHGRPYRFDDPGSVRLKDAQEFSSRYAPGALRPDVARLDEFARAGMLPLLGGQDWSRAQAMGANAMDGGPLRLRLLLSMLTGLLIRLADGPREGFADIPGGIAQALADHFQAQGLPVPDDLEVTAGEPRGGATPLSISFTPDAEILPARAKVAFGFSW